MLLALKHSLYSMKQAIDEGFIIDVLKNYTTYETYWKLHQVKEDDPLVEEGKAKAICKSCARTPKHNQRKDSDNDGSFWNHTERQIAGKAKAMIVTSSRKLAVEYRLAVDKWIEENGANFKALVAFTDTIEIDGKPYTENSMNGFPDTQTAARSTMMNTRF